MTTELHTCSICEEPIPVEVNGGALGHNAAPVNDGRCCEECNDFVVVPTRIRLIVTGMEKGFAPDWNEHTPA